MIIFTVALVRSNLNPALVIAVTRPSLKKSSLGNPDDVIGRALEVLRLEDEWLDENKTVIGEKIDRAFGQFERGEFFLAEQSRADMERRKAKWLREHGA